MEFLRRCRLDHAKRHIEFTELKAAEIASMVGFKDEFQFSRAFKKHFGMPPTSFRRTQFQTAASPGETGHLRPFVE
jgi:iron complex transport system substrate-binding protein